MSLFRNGALNGVSQLVRVRAFVCASVMARGLRQSRYRQDYGVQVYFQSVGHGVYDVLGVVISGHDGPRRVHPATPTLRRITSYFLVGLQLYRGASRGNTILSRKGNTVLRLTDHVHLEVSMTSLLRLGTTLGTSNVVSPSSSGGSVLYVNLLKNGPLGPFLVLSSPTSLIQGYLRFLGMKLALLL